MEVIHITGPAGSGKSTLGHKLAKTNKYLVFDTDDVSESIHKKLMPRNKSLFIKNQKKYFKKYFAEVAKWKQDIIKCAKKEEKNVVIVGFALDIADIVTDGYILYLNDKTVYRRRLKRDFQHLLDNKKEIMHIIEREPVEVIEHMFWYKIGIHHGFPAPPFNEAFAWQHKNDQELIKKKGYKKMTPGKIYAKLK